MKSRFTATLACTAALFMHGAAQAQDTSISYQGYMTDNGAPIPGPTQHPMTFRLYAQENDVAPLANGTIGPVNVTVTNSLFQTPLPFPVSLWTGQDRWLEVQVGTEVLTPRTKIRWTPYAVYALNAADRNSLDASDGSPADAVFVNASGFTGVGTTSPQARLHVSDDSIWLGGTDALGFAAAAGPGMRFFNTPTESNINAADYSTSTPRPLVLQHQGGSVGIGGLPAAGNKLDVTGQVEMDAFKMATGAAAGRVLTSDANGVGTWQPASGGGGPWSTIGTVDIANNNTGNVGVGTGATAPSHRLTVVDTQAGLMSIPLEVANVNSTAGTTTAINFRATATGAPKAMLALERINTFGRGRFHFLLDNVGDDLPADLSDSKMSIDYFGNVGIGTTAPTQRLSVAGTVQSTVGGFMFPDGTVQTTASTIGGGFWTPSGTNIFNNNAGFVGVGTNNPQELLHVRRDQNAVTTLRLENLNNTTTGGTAMLFRTPSDVAGLFKTATLSLDSGVNGGAFEITTEDLKTFSNSLAVSGVLGGFLDVESRANFAGKVYVRNTTDEAVVQLAGGGNNDSGEIRLYRQGQAVESVEIVGSDSAGQGGAIALRRSNGVDGIYLNAEEGVGRGGAINVYNNSGQTTVKLDGDFNDTGVGRVITDVLEITGADLAEKFPASEEIAPGMVVAIDVEHEGKLCLARGAYNHTVAGVVSGAKDFSVGAILGSRTESADGPPIALAGRVYVWCDADAAPIKPGDLLTTSEIPGHAMKVQDHAAAQGAILGKAMGSLDKGHGLVLVLVNLQ